MTTDPTHTVLASVPLAGILYTVVAEVAWVEDDPIFGSSDAAKYCGAATANSDKWVCRLLEVRYRLKGSEVWNVLPEWAEPKYSVRQTIEDFITAAMDRGIGIGYEPFGRDPIQLSVLKSQHSSYTKFIDYLITANA